MDGGRLQQQVRGSGGRIEVEKRISPLRRSQTTRAASVEMTVFGCAEECKSRWHTDCGILRKANAWDGRSRALEAQVLAAAGDGRSRAVEAQALAVAGEPALIRVAGPGAAEGRDGIGAEAGVEPGGSADARSRTAAFAAVGPGEAVGAEPVACQAGRGEPEAGWVGCLAVPAGSGTARGGLRVDQVLLPIDRGLIVSGADCLVRRGEILTGQGESQAGRDGPGVGRDGLAWLRH